jgi:hypothetical protein
MTEYQFGDISEEFEFDEAAENYYDGPLSGWARSRRSGQWFAYECQGIIADVLWHWTLVPVAERTDVKQALIEAAKKKEEWVSIIEDRRAGGGSRCHLFMIAVGRAQPPVTVGPLSPHRRSTDRR